MSIEGSNKVKTYHFDCLYIIFIKKIGEFVKPFVSL